MIRVRRTVLVSVAAVASVALVAACGSSGGNSSSTKSPSSGQVAPPSKNSGSNDGLATTPRSELKSGGKINWMITETIPNFNYYELDGSLLDNFSMFNSYLPNPFHFSASAVPSVNTDYFTSITKTSSSPQTIEYKINPKAKWSDGTALSWEDFYYLWKACNGSNSKFNVATTQGFDQIKSVSRGANDQDVIVKFQSPFTDWQSLFQPLMPQSLTKTPKAFNTGWIAKPAVTAGPFKWASEDKTQHSYTVVRDPNWWGQPALLDSITFVVYNNPATAVQALGSHELDYDDITGGDIVANVQAVKQYPGIAVRETAGNIYRQFTLNTHAGPFTDEKVRQAFVLGVDRKTITTALIGKLGGNPAPLQNHFFMKNQAPYAETCGEYCNYDPAKAKSLLQSDGWTMKNGYFTKGGKELDIAITIPADTPNSKLEAEIAQNSLKAAGIKLTLKTVPTNDFFAKYIDPSNFDVTTYTWYGTQFPVGGALAIFKYDPKNKGQNYGFGGTPAINTMLQEAATAQSPDQEDTLANDASKVMWTNAAWLPLYQKPQAAAVNAKVFNLGAYGFADIRYQDIGFKA